MNKISVIIPTYRRIPSLIRCLSALEGQLRPPDEVIVVVRDSDEATQSYLSGRGKHGLNLRIAFVQTPGLIAALNAGLDSMSGDIAAITDDDTMPRKDWLKRIEAHFLRDPSLGGLGGRDWVHENGKPLEGAKRTVGKIQWFGRMIGNHHLGVGEPREVDFLKGANMAYRRDAIRHIRFRSCLRGTGAQVCNETDFCLQIKKAGWKLVYDPAVAVDHYPAPRPKQDERNTLNAESLTNWVHNETFALMSYLGRGRSLLYLIWVFAVGTAASPGFLQWLRLFPKGPKTACLKWKATVKGRIYGIQTWRRMKGEGSVESWHRDADRRHSGRSGNHASSPAEGKQANC